MGVKKGTGTYTQNQGGLIMERKECIAMILAGGQGSRLGILTRSLAKPAVPFGGRYRIIDFTLSNCSNSDIDTIGVLTQYQPLVLNSHIGIGSPWNLDRNIGGVVVLPPYINFTGREWYKGTANAIYQNIGFIDMYDPEYVLILSGDHIYKMDYSKMLEYHKEKNSEATIAVFEVPLSDARRFGIMNTDSDCKVIEFDEKPKHPKNNLASMGIYIFNWDILKRFLIEDELDTESSHDFGKNIIPKMLKGGINTYAYPFKGYWRDVGTIESYYNANMDLLSDEPELDLYDSGWKIYSSNSKQPPSYTGPYASIKDSLVNEGCIVLGNVENSILFSGVYVGRSAVVKNSIIFPNVKIEEGAVVDRAIICEGSTIGREVYINENCPFFKSEDIEISESGIIVVGKDTIGKDTIIEKEGIA